MSRPWTDAELRLLGTQPDADVGRLIGRPYQAVWAKRKAAGVPGAPPLVRRWANEEDRVVLSQPVAEAARLLGRTLEAIRIRRAKLRRANRTEPPPRLLNLEEARLRIEVARYDSKAQEERVRFVGGPYAPPLVPVGGTLQCVLRGEQEVAGYTQALIPWPLAAGHARQFIICGDLVKALQTESRPAVAFHFGLSRGMVSEFRRRLGIERLTAGSHRLIWRNVNLARTPEAQRKRSQKIEGRGDTMTPEARERLRRIQQRPKSEEWKRRMSERQSRRPAMLGPRQPWSGEELALLGTRPDHEIAQLLNRSLSAVKAKKFQLRLASGQPRPAALPQPVPAGQPPTGAALSPDKQHEPVATPSLPPGFPEPETLGPEDRGRPMPPTRP
jgi:hypothetical protein